MRLLATTALEWSWGEGVPLVFLGEWCRKYERREQWSARAHDVVRNHWDDRAKLLADHTYLQRLRDEMLADLARSLGQLHGVERSARFWQTLLDPWLGRYLAAVFDRWECLRVAFEEHDVSATITRAAPRHACTRDHAHFLNAVLSDEWNHDLCADILRYEYSQRCAMRPDPGAPMPHGDMSLRLAQSALDWKRRAAYALDRALSFLGRGNDYLFVHSYFPVRALAALNFRLGQVPGLYHGDFSWPDPAICDSAPFAPEMRRQLIPQRPPSSRFESFLHARVVSDIPQVAVEWFEAIRSRARSVRLRPRVVFTANAHMFNDLFKHWVAEQTHRGVRLVVMDHGNSVPPQFGAMYFEEDIADVKTTWGLPFHPKHVRLPANKLAGQRRTRSDGTRLLVVGSEMPAYANDAASVPIAGQALAGFELVCHLHDALGDAPRRAFIVKPYPNMGWQTHQRFLDRLGPDKVSPHARLSNVMKTARMIVCTYPQTTFSEAIASGAPALLVYPRHLWETVPLFDALVETLHAARIVFFDAHAAAAHINSIWDDPQQWWLDAPVRAARARFEAEALDLRPDWIEPWLEFIRRQLPEAVANVSAVTGKAHHT